MEIRGYEYRVDFRSDGIAVLWAKGRKFADFKVGSSCKVLGGEDQGEVITGPEVSEFEGGTLVRYLGTGGSWKRKEYRFFCHKDHIGYEFTVWGKGQLDKVDFFDGAQPDSCKRSLYHYSRVFSPETSLLDKRYYVSMQYTCIDAAAGAMAPIAYEPLADSHYVFTPPPLAYALGFFDGTWLGAGIMPLPGEYNFTRFEHWGRDNAVSFVLTYDGMVEIKGEWTSPRFLFHPAGDEYDAVSKSVRWGVQAGRCVWPKRNQPEWWTRPILCGWGEQVVMGKQVDKCAQDMCNQKNYDHFLELTKEFNIHPGTMVLDDKWMKVYSSWEPDPGKWPDLRAWIDQQHAAGRKVLLWWPAWHTEALPDDQRIINPDGGLGSADPSNPKYQERLTTCVRQMLSSAPDGLNADGFKIDFTNCTPVGPGHKVHGPQWGIELLRLHIQLMHDAAKATKPDALIMTHTAHPYFADIVDMLRLNDIFAAQRDVGYVMEHRAKIARIACPEWLIDCDNNSMPTRDEWFAYMLKQPEIGIPSLYFLTRVDGTMEEIPREDWKSVAPIWAPGKCYPNR